MSLSALGFILFFAIGCLLAFVRHPIFGLVTYVGVFYVHPPSRWWAQGIVADVRWALVAAGVTMVAMLMRPPATPTAPISRSGFIWGFIAMVAWVALQSLWAVDPEEHATLLSYYLKFILVVLMICRCIETPRHLAWFLWAHVAGCFYLGWLAFTSYAGGRLDGVGGPGIDEANAAALQMVTGIFVAAALFLSGRIKSRAALLAMIPIMVNGLVTTISRSGFLAAGAGGLAFNLLAPKRYRRAVGVLSVLALALFLMLTNDIYWQRISTIKYQGAEVEGVDTGGGRLQVIGAQWKMSKAHPFGCGHMCTTVLSPRYVPERYLTGGVRASHNTFMTMLVDHGFVGAGLYILMQIWILRKLFEVHRLLTTDDGLLGAVLPALAAIFGAIFIGDLFAQFPKYEARIWFLSVLVVVIHLAKVAGDARVAAVAGTVDDDARSRVRA